MAGVEGQGPFLPAALYQVKERGGGGAGAGVPPLAIWGDAHLRRVVGANITFSHRSLVQNAGQVVCALRPHRAPGACLSPAEAPLCHQQWLLQPPPHLHLQARHDSLTLPPLTTPPHLYKLRQSPILIRSLRLLWLGQGRSLCATHTTTNTGHPRSKRENCTVSWCKKGEYNAQTSPKSELCGFKWANTHNKRVHDSM